MKDRFLDCFSCPASHLLTESRKRTILKWESKRQSNIDRMKKIRLILLGESMPSKRYFYDINTSYEDNGMRYNLKKEFDQSELTDVQFFQSFRRKGIVLHDCGFCPVHKLNSNTEKRNAATFCLLTQNIEFLHLTPEIPIITIFPFNRGWLKNEVPDSIKKRIIAEFSFNKIKGIKDLYNEIKSKDHDNIK